MDTQPAAKINTTQNDTGDPTTSSQEQFGVRKPDGSYVWDYDTTLDEYHHNLKDVAESDRAHARYADQLEDDARQLCIDPDWYCDNHQLVKRGIVVTIHSAAAIHP